MYTSRDTVENPSFNPECPACVARCRHNDETWKHHPYAGHGYSPETRWTHPDLGVAR